MGLHVVEHPLVKHKLGLLRSVDTPTNVFRAISKEITRFLMYEVTRDFPLNKKVEKGWAGPVEVDYISGKMATIVPILRAGLGLMEGALDMVPGCKISVVGLYRDEETLEPVEYYVKLAKDISSRVAIILDPMLATGGSACDALDALKKRGCKKIKFMAIIGAPEGVSKVAEAHPDIPVYVSTLDRQLNENGYILPGLGDAGDRLFGTK